MAPGPVSYHYSVSEPSGVHGIFRQFFDKLSRIAVLFSRGALKSTEVFDHATGHTLDFPGRGA